MPDKREVNAIAQIDCPRCGAKKGRQCVTWHADGTVRMTPTHAPACCAERRRANQERRRATGEAGPVSG